MSPVSIHAATLSRDDPGRLSLGGAWTSLGLGDMEAAVQAQAAPAQAGTVVDATQVSALDSAGAWLLHQLLLRLRGGDSSAATLQGLDPQRLALVQSAAAQAEQAAAQAAPAPAASDGVLQALGRWVWAGGAQGGAVLALVGEVSVVLARCVVQPQRWRWRQVLFNIRSAGVDALPIVGLLAFLLGIVVAYQSADQLRQFGANIFIVDVVGLSMLREFAPMMTAIIVAGRSGSAYAAQIGTMAVTEEIDAMRSLGIAPLELLVLPKLLALLIALPLLTLFADVMGVLGGMLMARTQLDVSFVEFLVRLPTAVSVSSFLVGIGKAPVFAAIIVFIGCFQGLQTRGGADSVGQHTTRSVVQSIFLVILADALFSIAFSALDL